MSETRFEPSMEPLRAYEGPSIADSNEKIRRAIDQIRGARIYSDADLGKLLAMAFDEGFTACAYEHIEQAKNPMHPITRGNPYRQNSDVSGGAR